MTTVDQDGTSPALIAADGGRLDVIKALHEFGVDLQAHGHIYDGDFKLLRNMTQLRWLLNIGGRLKFQNTSNQCS